MKKTVKRILSTLLTAVMLLGMLPAVSLASDEFTVVMSVEGLTLGQGIYVEPKAYTLGEINALLRGAGYGECSETTLTAALATAAMLLDNGLEFVNGGDGMDTFYLESVTGIDKGFTAIPDFITLNGGPSDEENDGNGDDKLGEYDYSSMSGWMVSCGEQLLPVGAGEYILHDGDVLRWQFSVWGWGADLGYKNEFGEESFFRAAEKDALYAAYAFGTDSEAKAAALAVMEKIDASQEEVDRALAALTGSGQISASFKAANFASLELYSADDLQRADDLLSGVEPTNGRYSVELDEGDYVLTGRSANGADLGSIAVSVSESGCDHTVYAITATCKNAGWAYGRDYTVSGRAFSGGGGGVPVERSIVMGANGSFLCFVGDSVTAKFDPSAARIREGYAPASAGSVVTGPNYASLSAECSPAAVLNITYPYADKNEDGENDFVLEAGQLTQYFIYSYLTPDTVERPDGGETVTAVFEGLGKGNYFYRVSDPLNDDAVTYGNYCSAESGDNHVSVSAQDMHIGDDALKKNTVIDDFSANAYDTGDLYLAVTGSGFDGAAGQLNMSSGDVAALYPFRNWLAIEGTGNSKVIEPDFHVEVTDLVGSPVTVTEKTADDSSKHSYAIEAVSPGTAILTVTYDAVINGAGLGGSVFSAIRPENTGVIVVTVDGQSGFDTHITINEALNTDQTGKLAHEKYDAELDVLYYCGTDGASYTFRPDSGTEVTVAAGSCDGGRLSFGEFSDAGVSAAPDTGEVTVSGLMQGKSVIRLVKDGKTEYQVLRARHTDLVVKNAAGEIYCDTSTGYIDPEMRFEPGEKISLTYSDIQHPANKLSGIYNMQANVMLIGSGGAAVNGKAAQYDFGSAAAAHRVNVIIPEDAQGTYALTGVIRVNGYGSYFGQHRELTYEYGKTSNYTAVRQTGYFGMLPGAVLPIAGADAGTVTVAAYDYNAAEAGLSGASQTGVIFEQTIALSPGATAEEVVRAAFGQAGVDYEISGAGGSSAYVSSLNGLGAGAGMSGWVLNYNNDDFANWGLAYITPADGDSISFHYSVNPDGATDDVGSGWYGKAIFTSFTLAGVTREMSKITEYAQDYSAVTTYYLGSEVIDGSGTQDDPFILSFTLPFGTDLTDIGCAYTTQLGEHYRRVEGAGSDWSEPVTVTLSTNGGCKTYYRISAAEAGATWEAALESVQDYIKTTVSEPHFGATGGEWAVFALNRGGVAEPEWNEEYLAALRTAVDKKGGRLHKSKYTEYSRVVFALTSIGLNAARFRTDSAVYDLVSPLLEKQENGKYMAEYQGHNGTAFALLALNSRNYLDTEEGREARAALIESLKAARLENGAWSISGKTADIDTTAAVVYALAPYCNDGAKLAALNCSVSYDELKSMVDGAVAYLSGTQDTGGGFGSVEADVWVLIALSSLGRDADTDEAFVKEGGSLLDDVLSYHDAASGGFCHEPGGAVNQMASEQTAYGLAAYERFRHGKTALYDMSDVEFEKSGDTGAAVKVGGIDAQADGTVFTLLLPLGSSFPEASYISVFPAEGASASAPVTADGGRTWTFTVTAEDGTALEYTLRITVEEQTPVFDPSVNGLVQYGDKWIYVVNGRQDTSYSGLAHSEYGWWYVFDGALDLSFTGLVPNEYGTWYVYQGQLADWRTGLEVVDGELCEFYQGQLATWHSGIVQYGDGWVYIVNGRQAVSYSGLTDNEYGWWYVFNGALDLSFTGLVTNEYGTWYVYQGQLVTWRSGLEEVDGQVCEIYNGQLATWHTGIVQYGESWIYLANGMHDTDYSGLAHNEYGWWYVFGGALDLSFTGLETNEYGTWFVYRGQLADWRTGIDNVGGQDYEFYQGQLATWHTGEYYDERLGAAYQIAAGIVVG